MKLALIILTTGLAFGQVQTIYGLNGIGHGSMVSVDRDGDGYGAGPIAIVQATAGGAISTGVQTITPSSMTGTITATTNAGSNLLVGLSDQMRSLQVGEVISGTGIPTNTTVSFIYGGTMNEEVLMSNNATVNGTATLTIKIAAGTILRVDLGVNMERIQVTSVTSTTFTANFLIAHASGCSILDQGVIGPDADDLDVTVWNYTQAANKYDSGTVGSLPNFRQKLANDILLENAFAQDVNLSAVAAKAMTAAVAAGLTSPTHIWYFGTSGAVAPFSAGSDLNTCASPASPCLTFAASAFASTYASGDLIYFGPNASLYVTPTSGTSSKHSTFMAYPGVRTLMDLGVGSGFIQAVDRGYLTFIGLHMQNGGQINGGTTPGNSPDSNNVYVSENDMYNCGANACVNAFQAVNNWVIEDNVAAANVTQHGIYMGAFAFYNSGQLASTGLVVRRNLLYWNNFSGFHFNGFMSYGVLDQNISWDNGSNNLSLQNGWHLGFVRSNITFGAGYGPTDMAYDFQFYNYPDTCGDTTRGNEQYLCPSDQNFNLVENNTFYNTSSSFGAIEIANFTNGCVSTASTCPTPTLQGDIGNNVYRNNIFVGYGNTNVTSAPYHHPPIYFANCTPGTSPNLNGTTTYPYIGPCLFNTSDTYLPTSTFDHNIVFELGPYADSNAIGWGPEASDLTKYTSHGQTQGFGYFPLTWAAAATAGAAISGNLNGDPKFVSASLSYTNSLQYDLRLLASSSPAFHAGSTTAIPGYDAAGRAFVDATPSIGGLESNLFKWGWNDLGSATKMQYISGGSNSVPSDGTPSNTNNINYGGTGGSCPGSFCYPFSTDASFQIRAWTDGILRDAPGITKQMCWFGGGHTDYIGNEIYCVGYNAASPAIQRITGPSTFTGDPGTGATFAATIGGGVLTGCTVLTGGSDYIGEGQVLWTPTGGDTIVNGYAVFTVSGGAANSCTLESNQVMSGFNHVPTGSTANYTTPALAWLESYPTMPQLTDGSPNSTHSTGSLSYDPTRDQFIKFGGAYAGTGPHWQDTFAFNFGSRAWARKDPTACGGGCSTTLASAFAPQLAYNLSFDSLSFYNALTDSHFYLADSGGAILQEYQPSTNTWVYGGTTGVDIGNASSSSGFSRDIIPDRQLGFFIGASLGSVYSAYKIDLTKVLTMGGSSLTDITSSVSVSGGTSCAGWWKSVVNVPAGASGNYSPGFTWNPALSKFVAYAANAGGTWNTLDPDSLNCQTFAYSGGPAASSNAWIEGRMRYSPSVDGEVLMQDYGQDLFVLSHNAPDPTGAAPTGFGGVTISGPVRRAGPVTTQ